MKCVPKIIAWEVTRRCRLNCRHCRGAASDRDYAGEFSTAECFKTVEALVRAAGKPLLILTGGEPLMRDDFHEIATYATACGCRVVLATCGYLLTPQKVDQLQSCGIMAVSTSLDSASAALHDGFRGVPGAYQQTLRGLACLKKAGIPFQINTTVSKLNVHELPQILEKAITMGAATMDFFFLVPTGRGETMADMALAPEARDKTLQWIAEQERNAPLRVKTTCAPLYQRFRLPDLDGHASAPFRGCMGGRGFVFISHTGKLQPCGFLELPCGDLRSSNFDFEYLYETSGVFRKMRARNPYDECPAREFAAGNMQTLKT